LWVKSGNTRREQMFSAPHPIADIGRQLDALARAGARVLLLRHDGQNSKKHAACFARRVKRASQKYSSFRESEIMI
jgi:hypothetical protein